MKMYSENVIGTKIHGSQVPVCVGRDNNGVTSYPLQLLIPRNISEKTSIVPGFMTLRCPKFGGCTSPKCEYATKEAPIHFFGLLGGYKCPEITIKSCAEMLSQVIAEEWGKEADVCNWKDRWENAIYRAFTKIEGEFENVIEKPTILVAIVSPCQVLVANDDYSKAILFRGTNALSLLDRQVNPTIPHLIPKGFIEVFFMRRNQDDDFLFLATNGLWEGVSCDQVKNSLDKETRQSLRDQAMRGSVIPAGMVASHVISLAMKNICQENISMVVVDLKFQEGR